jgi:hypothetical protein
MNRNLPGLIRLIFVFIICRAGVSAQSETSYSSLFEAVQNAYGFNQELVNGTYYEDMYRNAIGHPFFQADEYQSGMLLFRNRAYGPLEMKYDIYDQKILVKYTFGNSIVLFIPPVDFIDQFTLNGKTFIKYGEPGKEQRFFQVIGPNGNLQCFYHWRKTRNDSYHMPQYLSHEFHKSDKKCYLLLNNELKIYRGNRSFVNLFPKQAQKKIRHFIKNQKIKVTKSNDEKIAELTEYGNMVLNDIKNPENAE